MIKSKTDKTLKLPFIKNYHCDTCIVYEYPKKHERNRTLDDYPMQHGLADAVRMLERRRNDDQEKKSNMAASNNESRTLSSYSRRRFESALTARRGEKPAFPSSDTDNALFFKEPTPSWSARPRHHSIAGVESKLDKPTVQIIERPDSEPPLPSRTWPGRSFDHARGRVEAYPEIRKLYRDYNSGLKVVCASPEKDCKEAWVTARRTGRASTAGDVLLMPVAVIQEEPVVEEVAVVEEPVVPVLPLEEGEDGDMMLLNDDEMNPLSRRSHMTGEPPEPEPEVVEEEVDLEPSPPWRCWVDDATVSSLASSTRETEVDTIFAAETPALQKSDPLTPAPEEKQPTVPNSQRVSLAQEPKKPTSGKGKKGKVGELPPPPPPPPEEPATEEPEEVMEEVEEELPPALPLSLCPSDVTKAHQAEVKLWLRKSPFSAARNSVPIFWT